MNFIKKMFGMGKAEAPKEISDAVDEFISGLFEIANLDLQFAFRDFKDDSLFIELSGADDNLLTEKDGQLLDGIQFFVKRALQHKLPENKIELFFDTNGYRENIDQELRSQADEMIDEVLRKKKPLYFRPLPPKQRKVIHQHLANNEQVKSRSVGDGLFKKVKIYPAEFDRSPRAKTGGERNSSTNA